MDPEGIALLGSLGEAAPPEGPTARTPQGWDAGGFGARVVVSGRREGHLVGLAVAWMDDSGGHVAVAVEPATRRQGVGSHLLAAVEAAVDRAGWRCARLAAVGPDKFYRARSARARVT